MLAQLNLVNFRPFRNFAVDLPGLSLLVGKNNMGKSTLVDALRLISLEANYRLRRDLVLIPERVFGDDVHGYLVEPERIPFPIANVHYEYGNTPSYVTARFDHSIEICLAFAAPPASDCYLAVRQDSVYLENVETIRLRLRDISIAVLPPVAPFEEREDVLTRKYVQEWFGTHRSPRHFRNVWYWDRREFDEFRRMLVQTWPGADVSLPELTADLRMYYTEDRMTREIAWAGHGMQVWMQILTYLAKMKDFDTLVLDEPEIYLHSDIQRKLVGLLRQRASQIIVATHSVDIINEAPPSSIIVIDKQQKSGRQLESIEHVQRVIEGLGSIQNIQLLSLLRSRFVLFVEGDDGRILRGIAEKLGYLSAFASPHLSIVPLEGGGNWRRLKDVNWILRNTIGEKIQCFVILDRDYETQNSVRSLSRSLQRTSVPVHVWKKKELENYLLVPRAIRAAIIAYYSRSKEIESWVRIEALKTKLMELADGYREHVSGQLLAKVLAERRSSGEDPSSTITSFNGKFAHRWASSSYRLSRIPGKDVVSDLSRWSQANFGVSLSAERIVGCMTPDDIDGELRATIDSIVDRTRVDD